jgi:hypothetical protein
VWIGDMDEVRIQNKARSANWIKLEWMNQKAAVTLLPPSISYIPSTIVDTVGYPSEHPVASVGGVVDGYSVSPALPNGLVLDPTTGMISGFPAGVTTATVYTVTATGPGGTSTATINLRVSPVSLLNAGARASTYSIRSAGKGLLFNLPEQSAPIRVSIADMAGRNVWSKVSRDSRQVAWDGTATDGSNVGGGVYIVHMNLVSEPGKPVFQRVLTYSPK